jgi:ribosomal protein S4
MLRKRFHKTPFIIPKYSKIFLKSYFYYTSFLIIFFNKFYKIFLKCSAYKGVLYWGLFSYTCDKYYTTINYVTPHNNSYFLDNSYLLVDDLSLVNELVNLKRDNAVFKSVESYDDYLTMDFYKFNTHSLTNVYMDDLQDIEDFSDDEVIEDEEEVDISDNVMSNFFKIKTKALISFNRKILCQFFNFKIKKQNRITPRINNFIKFKIKNSIQFFESTITNILLLSKFVFNSRQAYLFVKGGLVYLNGALVFKPDLKIKQGDNIQLLLSIRYLRYYSEYFNKLTNFSQKYHNKFLKNVDSPLDKKLRRNKSKLVSDLISFRRGIPVYLEVDFLTFSCYVVYTPFNFYYISNKSFNLYNFYLNRLYNWKFLT